MPTLIPAPDPDANTYASAAEADAYFDARVDSGAWGEADADDRARALVSAARRIDQERFRGVRADPDQPMAWPRAGVRDEDGVLMGTETVPARVKRAQMNLALVMLAGGFLDDLGLDAFRRAKVGPLEVELKDGVPAGALPDDVRRELWPFVLGSRNTISLSHG
jgi:hypothetical protein